MSHYIFNLLGVGKVPRSNDKKSNILAALIFWKVARVSNCVSCTLWCESIRKNEQSPPLLTYIYGVDGFFFFFLLTSILLMYLRKGRRPLAREDGKHRQITQGENKKK